MDQASTATAPTGGRQGATPAARANAISPSGLMDPKAAAEYLGTTVSTLAVWRCTNRQKLPYVKIGGLVRYRQSDLDQFITAGLIS